MTKLFTLLSCTLSLSVAFAETSRLLPLKNRDDLQQKIAATKPTVILFTSATCGACSYMTNALTALSKKYAQVDFYSVNASADAFKGIAKELNLPAFPTSYFIVRGEKKVVRGAGPHSESQAEEEIKKLIEGPEEKPAARRVARTKK